MRPTEQVRVAATLHCEQFDRKTDGTTVLSWNTQRVRAEYQITRQVFFRVSAEEALVRQDALRDDSRTEAPLYLRAASSALQQQRLGAYSRVGLRRHTEIVSAFANVTHARYGRNSTPASVSRRQKAMSVSTIASQSNTALIVACAPFRRPKKNQLQAELNTNCTAYKTSSYWAPLNPSKRHTRQAATAISTYSTLQAGPKSHAGGAQRGRSSSA